MFKDFKLNHVLIPSTPYNFEPSYNNYTLFQQIGTNDFFNMTHELSHIIEPKEGEDHIWNSGKIILKSVSPKNTLNYHKVLKRELKCYLIQKQIYATLKLEDINSRLSLFYDSLKKEFLKFCTYEDFSILMKQLNFRCYKDIVKIFNDRI